MLGPEDHESVFPDPDNGMLNTCQDDYSFDEKDDDEEEDESESEDDEED